MSNSATDHVRSPRLVGREREEQALNERVALLCAGHGGLTLLGGPAGIGKTSLARELELRAGERGVRAVTGHCYDLTTTPPYGPWRELLGQIATVAEAAPRIDDSHEYDTAEALHARIRDGLVLVATTGPLALILEDFHWSDTPSLDLLRVVARGLDAIPLLLVVTYRTDELAHHDPLALLLPALVREAAAERLELRPLTTADIETLLQARFALSTEDEQRLATYLALRSEGNPFFLEELLRDVLETERLVLTDGHWVLGDLSDLGVPRLLRQVIAGRLARLAPAAQQQFAVASVIGQETPLALWSEIGGLPEESLLDIVEQGIAAQLLQALPDGHGVRFAHALIADALYDGILPPRRRVWHRQVAEALIRTSQPDPDRVAHHLQRASDPRAARWLVLAAERAYTLFATAEANSRAQAALAVLETMNASDRHDGWLLYRIAHLLIESSHLLAASRAALAEVLRIAQTTGDRLLEAYALLDAGQISNGLGDARQSLAQIEASVALFESLPSDLIVPIDDVPPVVRRAWTSRASSGLEDRSASWADTPIGGAYCREHLAWALFIFGRLGDACTVGDMILDAHRPQGGGDDSLIDDCVISYHTLGQINAWLGRPDLGRRRLLQCIACRMLREGPRSIIASNQSLLLRYVLLPYLTERVGERQALFDEISTHMLTDQPGQEEQLPAAVTLLPHLYFSGAWDETLTIALATVARPSSQFWSEGPLSSTILAALARNRGDSALAWEQVTAILPNGLDTRFGDRPLILVIPAQQTAIELALDASDLDLAHAWLELHDVWFAASGAVLYDAERLLLWARYHKLASDHAAARETAQRALIRASDPRQPLALMAADRMLGELATEAGVYSVASAHLTASLDLATRCEIPFEQALTLVAQAELGHASGDHAAARSALTAAAPIAERLKARPTLEHIATLEARLPTRRTATEYPAGLSAREVEVLRLVAEGLPTPEIAERLFLSPRTVTTHLTSIYTKLGVNSRAAATRFAVEHGLTSAE